MARVVEDDVLYMTRAHKRAHLSFAFSPSSNLSGDIDTYPILHLSLRALDNENKGTCIAKVPTTTCMIEILLHKYVSEI